MIGKLWRRLFLEERPSIGLALFRPALAWTVGAHVIPSLLRLQDNYLSTAFKEKNGSFFPLPILLAVEASPEWLIRCAAVLFCVFTVSFGLGLFTQASAIAMTLGCYYFYALNSLHIGTLSYDILLVTLSLACVTGYMGDSFSLDQLRRGDLGGYTKQRPFFIQRLLQIQLAGTFWGTALGKLSADGNWISGNPYFALMHYPPEGVVRSFLAREWLAAHPQVCYGLGIALIGFEFLLPILWWVPRTRPFGIVLGIAFQLMLWLTLHVPTIFLFLFPALMLLFVPPETWLGLIERARSRQAQAGRALLVYDGRCGFCQESVKRVQVLDLFGYLDLRDCHALENPAALYPALSRERCAEEMILIEPGGRLSGGFEAFRRMTTRLPLLMGVAPFVHLPGVAWLGTRVYRWVASHRYLIWPRANACAVGPDHGSANT